MSDDSMNGAGEEMEAEYRALLRELSGAAPLDAAELSALHERIESAAELPLARMRHASVASPSSLPDESSARGELAWWEYAARRGRPALWLSVAASLLLAAYVGMHPLESGDVESSSVLASADVRDAFASAVTTGESSNGVTSLLVTSTTEPSNAVDGIKP